MLDVKEVCDARDSMCLTGDRFVMQEIQYSWRERGLWGARFYKPDRREVCDAGDFIYLTEERYVVRAIPYAWQKESFVVQEI